MEENSEKKLAQAVVKPAPDHMCVFVCDLETSKGCLGRSAPIAYGKRNLNGWRVIPGGDEFTICANCWNQMFETARKWNT